MQSSPGILVLTRTVSVYSEVLDFELVRTETIDLESEPSEFEIRY